MVHITFFFPKDDPLLVNITIDAAKHIKPLYKSTNLCATVLVCPLKIRQMPLKNVLKIFYDKVHGC